LLRADANRCRFYDDRDDVPNDPAKTLTKRFGVGAPAGMKALPGRFFRVTQQEKFGLRAWLKWTPVAKTNMLALGVWGRRI
jgi:hypothetical protein